jgi:hypothetical protein
MTSQSKYEYRVLYRRRRWRSRNVRLFQSERPAQRLAGKLLRGRPFRLELIVELYVQRRQVGEWEDVPIDVEGSEVAS